MSKYYSNTTYFLVVDDNEEDADGYDTKEDVIDALDDFINDGDFEKVNIKIIEHTENNYASWDEQEIDDCIFECNATYNNETEKADIEIIENEIGIWRIIK